MLPIPTRLLREGNAPFFGIGVAVIAAALRALGRAVDRRRGS